jgi:hypothetical protein
VYTFSGSKQAQYEEYINKDGREFRLICTVNNKPVDHAHISSVAIEQDLVSGAEDYIVGNLGLSKLIITFDSSVTVAEGSKIYICIELKTVTSTGLIEWLQVPIGSFNVFEIKKTALTQKIEAYDNLYQKALEDKYNSKLVYPTTTHEILSELCSKLSIKFISSRIPDILINRPAMVTDLKLNDDGKYEVVETDSNQVGFGLTIGAMMSYMASYLGGNFILEGDNSLKLIRLYTEDVHKSYTTRDYTTPTVGDASYDIICLKCEIPNYETLVYGAGEEYQTMSIINPFFDAQRTSELAAIVTNIKYKPVQAKIKGDPAMQLGDLVKLIDIPHIGTLVFPILKLKLTYSGGCGLTVESVCRSKSTKEINYRGTMSSRIETLETTVSKTKTEVDKLYSSIRILNTLRTNLEGMDMFITQNTSTGTLGEYEIDQFQLILNAIEQNKKDFDEKYKLVYDNKYLKY